MVVHLLEPVAADLRIPRAWPCAAWLDQAGQECGATPAAPFRRICGHGHARDLHLCETHEDLAVTASAGTVACRDCAELRAGAHRCPVTIIAVPGALGAIRAARAPLIP